MGTTSCLSLPEKTYPQSPLSNYRPAWSAAQVEMECNGLRCFCPKITLLWQGFWLFFFPFHMDLICSAHVALILVTFRGCALYALSTEPPRTSVFLLVMLTLNWPMERDSVYISWAFLSSSCLHGRCIAYSRQWGNSHEPPTPHNFCTQKGVREWRWSREYPVNVLCIFYIPHTNTYLLLRPFLILGAWLNGNLADT